MGDFECAMLRHLLATLAYRGRNILKNMPVEAVSLRVHPDVRTPTEILVHVNSLLEHTYAALEGVQSVARVDGEWAEETRRYFDTLGQLDEVLSGDPGFSISVQERFIQGPIADALIHLGQIGLLRRMAGSPVAAEDYSRADIRVDHIAGSL